VSTLGADKVKKTWFQSLLAFKFVNLYCYIEGKGATDDDDDESNDDEDGGAGGGGGGSGGGGSSSAAVPEYHNPEFDLDPKIAAGLERIKRLDKQLFSKNAEAGLYKFR
jgi:hypothetical protein